MQDAVPLVVEVGLAQDRFPGLPHDVVAGAFLLRRRRDHRARINLVPCHQSQHFDGRSSAEQRKDQRLDDAERAANRARVSPRFEVMRTRDVPLHPGRCFVDRVPERDRVRYFRQRRGEVEIRRGIEDRIAAQDDERLDRASLHRGDERGQRAHAGKRRILRLVIADRRPRVAKMAIQGAHGGVDRRGLAFPGDDQPLAAIRQKIFS